MDLDRIFKDAKRDANCLCVRIVIEPPPEPEKKFDVPTEQIKENSLMDAHELRCPQCGQATEDFHCPTCSPKGI